MANWAKLKDGSWGVRTESGVKAGATIQVQKKSGEVQTVTVAKVLWHDDKNALCSILPTPRPASSDSPRSGGRCCAECGRGGLLIQDLEDGQMKHYNCCDIPS